MRLALPAATLLSFLVVSPAQAQDQLRIELNALEPVQNRCRLSFVIENRGPAALETMKLDLAVFNPEGVIQRRLVVELGPIRQAKTVVKAFELDAECTLVGSVMVNEVTACAPPAPGACLDQLALSSRPAGVRFYK